MIRAFFKLLFLGAALLLLLVLGIGAYSMFGGAESAPARHRHHAGHAGHAVRHHRVRHHHALVELRLPGSQLVDDVR